MNIELELELFNTYPHLFTEDFRGMGINDGWRGILIGLFDAISNHTLGDDFKPVVILDIQKIYGELHIHFLGVDDVINNLIKYSNLVSIQTCEICGGRGKGRSGFELKTLCEEHKNYAS